VTYDEGLYNLKAGVLKAIAHPARLAMVEALGKGELCVCELQALVGSDMSTVSKHLSVLRNAGVVTSRKKGLWMYYQLCCPCILDFLDCIDAVIRTDAELKMSVCKTIDTP